MPDRLGWLRNGRPRGTDGGEPSARQRAEHHRLTVLGGLAALSLDALSSVAYGPEAIVIVLALAGGRGVGFTLPVTVAIATLLAVLTISYRQVIAAFPEGGGAYGVAKKHLSRRASLVAGASLIVDYGVAVPGRARAHHLDQLPGDRTQREGVPRPDHPVCRVDPHRDRHRPAARRTGCHRARPSQRGLGPDRGGAVAVARLRQRMCLADRCGSHR